MRELMKEKELPEGFLSIPRGDPGRKFQLGGAVAQEPLLNHLDVSAEALPFPLEPARIFGEPFLAFPAAVGAQLPPAPQFGALGRVFLGGFRLTPRAGRAESTNWSWDREISSPKKKRSWCFQSGSRPLCSTSRAHHCHFSVILGGSETSLKKTRQEQKTQKPTQVLIARPSTSGRSASGPLPRISW